MAFYVCFVAALSLLEHRESHLSLTKEESGTRLLHDKDLYLDLLHKFQSGAEDSGGWKSCFIPEHGGNVRIFYNLAFGRRKKQ